MKEQEIEMDIMVSCYNSSVSSKPIAQPPQPRVVATFISFNMFYHLKSSISPLLLSLLPSSHPFTLPLSLFTTLIPAPIL